MWYNKGEVIIMKKIIYLDLDGVLANFNAGVKREIKSIDEDVPECYEKGFYRNLPVMPGAIEFVNRLIASDKYEIYIASKPVTKTFYCPSEKYEWVNEHFPMLIRKMFLTCDKGLLRGDYLVDDHLKWAEKFEGETFVFNSEKPIENFESIAKILEI